MTFVDDDKSSPAFSVKYSNLVFNTEMKSLLYYRSTVIARASRFLFDNIYESLTL